ncbi:plasmid pRiA4b ORF-3 family protein [Nonomuraea sp. SYSU D8015]|uniref:plasmid pRiA4b ORF-3 family protein n=1 Tax=Nonomuraea sp. SYSU D8015 TaxID=2593644 RepID=UPI001660B499|nr:plasmid pRiA4b ORF-3 family protein [Nonomuraea sp. SYSU D8015]
MSQLAGARPQVHHLKITLQDIRPAVWRRLQVSSEMTLGELSDVLQGAFAWEGEHLHKFIGATVEYVPKMLLRDDPLLGFGPPLVHEDSVRLVQVAPRRGAVLDYVYDLGGEWRHRVEVEEITEAEPDTRYPVCTEGRGAAPEEDSHEYTPATFTENDREALNRWFRHKGARLGRDLPVSVKEIDRVFAALFPWLVQGEGEDRVLRARRVASIEELGEQAAASELVRRAVALADWVGSGGGRAVTPSRVLRPDDAVQAVDELGLDEFLLPALPEIEVPSGDGVPRPERKLRSAKDLPALHGLWCAAVESGLIEIRGSKAVAGDAVRTWEDEPLETWARLLAELMRARVQAEQEDRSYYGRQAPQEVVFPITAEILDELAERPLPVLLPALPIAAATGDVTGLYGLSGSLLGAVHAAMGDWALAGVIERTDQAVAPSLLEPTVKDLVAGFWREDDPSADRGSGVQGFLGGIPRQALDAVYGSQVVRLSSLGAYGVRRLLAAHGWAVTTV